MINYIRSIIAGVFLSIGVFISPIKHITPTPIPKIITTVTPSPVQTSSDFCEKFVKNALNSNLTEDQIRRFFVTENRTDCLPFLPSYDPKDPLDLLSVTTQPTPTQVVQQQQTSQSSQLETYCNDFVDSAIKSTDLSKMTPEYIRLGRIKLYSKCINGFPKSGNTSTHCTPDQIGGFNCQ